MSAKKWFICNCFFTSNYFIPQLNVHVNYLGKDIFRKDYDEYFKKEKSLTADDIESIVNQMEVEHERRCSLWKKRLERIAILKEQYKPLNPHVYKLAESFLRTEFLDIVSYCKKTDATLDGLLQKVEVQKAPRVYSFPVFTKEFCNDFLDEVMHFEKSDLPKGRPNTMNNYGILLDELGFDEGLMTPLRENYLIAISRILFPEWVGVTLDSHKAFIVSYSERHDLHLDYHYDNAEVTINIALASDYEDGSLYFGDMRTIPKDQIQYTEYVHKVSHGLIHRGQHKHGAMPVSDGERHNLIIWMRSSSVRNKLCPMCDKVPTLVETEGRGDGYTQTSVNVCKVV